MDESVDIVIIGAGLTGLTLAFYLLKAGRRILILEKNSVAGGVIQTHSKDGFVFESGPNTGVLNAEEIVDLFADLGGDCQPELPGENAKARWIWKSGRWCALGHGFKGAFMPLFNFKDKMRVLGEPWRKPGTNPDETVADMVIRRLGRSILDYAVDPFVSGIYAGNPHTLVTRYALPKLYRLEHENGSFIRGTIQKHKDIKSGKRRKVSGKVFSTKNGLKNLVDAFVIKIGAKNFKFNAKDVFIEPRDKAYRISYAVNNKAEIVMCKKVVSTTASHALPAMLPFVEVPLMQKLNNLRYARVLQIAVGYNNWKGIPIDAYGGLIPSCENRQVLGVLFMSSLFQNRAPKGGALMSVFAGGMRHPEWLDKTDEEVKSIVKEELKVLLKVEEEPDLMQIFRYQHAIPQYEVSTGKRLEAINEVQRRYPGLILAGNIRDGIGMADRVKQAKQIANKIIGND